MIPAYHTSYWMGLSVPTGLAWPDFEWVTPEIRGPASPYLNWGFPGQGPEPNEPGTGCAVAVGDTARGSPTGWGWGDASCGEPHFFICRGSGEAQCSWSGCPLVWCVAGPCDKHHLPAARAPSCWALDALPKQQADAGRGTSTLKTCTASTLHGRRRRGIGAGTSSCEQRCSS
jgi:hypothetical protein